MSARKAYIRLLISILIFSSKLLDLVAPSPAFLFLGYIGLFIWSVFPIVFGGKNTRTRPFQGDSNGHTLLTIFIVCLILVIFRGLLFNYGSVVNIITQLTNPYGLFAFLMPFIVFLNPRQFDFKHFVSIITLTGGVFLLYVFFNRGFLFSADYYSIANPSLITDEALEERGSWSSTVMFTSKLFMMMGFLMYIPSFIDKKRYWFVWLCWGVAFFCAAMGGRRGTCVTLILMALFSFYFYVNRRRGSATWFKYAFLLVAVFAVAYYVYSSFSGMFDIMADRIDADSRSEVFLGFWTDMGAGFDWIWGRGLNGQYYCPMNQNGTHVVYRNAVENGYLYLILVGGVIFLLLYIIVLLKAAIKGFFHSNNQLTKAFAAAILVSLFNLIPFGLPECSITFFVVWVGVAVCSSPYFRSLTDAEMKQLF